MVAFYGTILVVVFFISHVNSFHFSTITADYKRNSVFHPQSQLFRRKRNNRQAPEVLSKLSSTTNPSIHDATRNLQVIISGAPASGKGTQCEYIKEKFGLVHISTGELLRSAMRHNTELGDKVRVFMDAGKMVPDDIIIDVVCARLKQPDCEERGWLLDGFPRTTAQAEALCSVGHIADCFILLDVEQSILLDRVSGRRTDPVTGKVYHITHNPPTEIEIERRLIRRSDDTPDKLLTRYADYLAHTAAIRSFYQDRTIVLNGSDGREVITDNIQRALDAIQVKKKNVPVDPGPQPLWQGV